MLQPSAGKAAIFAHVPSPVVEQPTTGRITILARSEPTKAYGVGLVSSRATGGVRCAWRSVDHHSLWLQRSAPVSAMTRLDGRRFEYRPEPGTISICPAGMESVTESGDLAEGVFVRVSAECVALAQEQLCAHGGALVERLHARDEALVAIGRALEVEAAGGHPNGLLYWSSVADALIRRLAARHLSSPVTPPLGALAESELKRLDAYVRANLAEPLDVPGLAAVVGCDRFRFTRRFRNAVGVTPHRYVLRRRLERARTLIRTGRDSLSQIALATGFFDQSHLCHWMRKVHNLRPKDLRADLRDG